MWDKKSVLLIYALHVTICLCVGSFEGYTSSQCSLARGNEVPQIRIWDHSYAFGCTHLTVERLTWQQHSSEWNLVSRYHSLPAASMLLWVNFSCLSKLLQSNEVALQMMPSLQRHGFPAGTWGIFEIREDRSLQHSQPAQWRHICYLNTEWCLESRDTTIPKFLSSVASSLRVAKSG